MVRISNVDESLKFYCDIMGLELARKVESKKGRYTNFFLYAPNDKNGYEDKKSPALELTYNWDPEKYSGGRNFGHLAYRVNNIYDYCQRLIDNGVIINRPPRDGYMAFIKSPDDISIELLQEGDHLLPEEPWLSMKNIGSW
tara:strand:- start:23 stop:445 length:423 start_codon:yes stop_codon:yes gene_type:complete